MDYEGKLSTQSESFALIRQELEKSYKTKLFALEKGRSEERGKYEKMLRERDERYERDSAEAEALLDRYRSEDQGKMEQLRAALKDAEHSMEEKAQHNTILFKEKDARIAEIEQELTRLTEQKHEILQQYEEKVGGVLSNLHDLEKRFSSQREQHESEMKVMKENFKRELTGRSSLVAETMEKLETKTEELEKHQARTSSDAANESLKHNKVLFRRQHSK